MVLKGWHNLGLALTLLDVLFSTQVSDFDLSRSFGSTLRSFVVACLQLTVELSLSATPRTEADASVTSALFSTESTMAFFRKVQSRAKSSERINSAHVADLHPDAFPHRFSSQAEHPRSSIHSFTQHTILHYTTPSKTN